MTTIKIMKVCVPTEFFDYAVNDDGVEVNRGARVRVLEAGTTLRGEFRETTTRRQKDDKIRVFVEEHNLDKPHPDRLFLKEDRYQIVEELKADASVGPV